jgi:hypothetical protein
MIANTWKNFIGQSKMLVKNKVDDKKKSLEADFISWYSKSPICRKNTIKFLMILRQDMEK